MSIDNETFGKTFGNNLKRLRQSQGKTQTELSDMAFEKNYEDKSKQGKISTYESGKIPRLDDALRLANTLDVSVYELCGIQQPAEVNGAKWLGYLLNLLEFPPMEVSEGKSNNSIVLEQTSDGWSINFSSKTFGGFFGAYSGLKETKKLIPLEQYFQLIDKLPEVFGESFEYDKFAHDLQTNGISASKQDKKDKEVE